MRSRLQWFIAVALVGLGALPHGLAAASHDESPRDQARSVTVTGTGEVRVTPDMATVTLAVVTEADSVSKAVEQNNAKMQELLKTLRQAGIPERDIRTTQFNVQPRRHVNRTGETPPKIVGSTVTNEAEVKVRRLADLGGLLDRAVASGANRIQQVRMSVADPGSALDDARRKAMTDARHRARLYAEAAGETLGRPLTIREAASSPRPVYSAARRFQASAVAEAVPIAAGEHTFTARVAVTYALGPRKPQD